MKRKWKELKWMLTLCAAFGWWGMLYPEFTLLPETYRIVSETAESDAGVGERDKTDPNTTYYDILRTNTDHLVYKSRLLEEIDKLLTSERGTDKKGQRTGQK